MFLDWFSFTGKHSFISSKLERICGARGQLYTSVALSAGWLADTIFLLGTEEQESKLRKTGWFLS